MNKDYENDVKRQLSITDPSGNESSINKPAGKCSTCGLGCKYEKEGNCSDKVKMLDDLHQHMCEYHAKKMGADNIWYKSTPQKSEGPIQRMLGMQGDNVKELSNWGGTYKDEDPDSESDITKQDPRYTNG